jgi:DNA-binding IclR family transcriptional regulator
VPGPTTITAVVRAVAVLRVVASAEESLGVSEIARRCELPKSTTVRLLDTLAALDLVERVTEAGRYRVGAGLVRLASGTPAPGQLREVARPVLRALVDELGEDASLAVVDGTHLLYVEQVAAGQAVRVPDWSGQRIPYHVAAAGYVLLGSVDAQLLDTVLAGPLERWTAETLTDPDAVRTRVERTREVGSVWVHEEWADGIDGIAAPVTDAAGRIVAAINVHGPSYRFPGDRSATVIERAVVAAADRIGAALDGRSPPGSPPSGSTDS